MSIGTFRNVFVKFIRFCKHTSQAAHTSVMVASALRQPLVCAAAATSDMSKVSFCAGPYRLHVCVAMTTVMTDWSQQYQQLLPVLLRRQLLAASTAV